MNNALVRYLAPIAPHATFSTGVVAAFYSATNTADVFIDGAATATLGVPVWHGVTIAATNVVRIMWTDSTPEIMGRTA